MLSYSNCIIKYFVYLFVKDNKLLSKKKKHTDNTNIKRDMILFEINFYNGVIIWQKAPTHYQINIFKNKSNLLYL